MVTAQCSFNDELKDPYKNINLVNMNFFVPLRTPFKRVPMPMPMLQTARRWHQQAPMSLSRSEIICSKIGPFVGPADYTVQTPLTAQLFTVGSSNEPEPVDCTVVHMHVRSLELK